ncbi:Mismatch repair endonuclease PMS2 [Vanrija pseudolonga]|uniref:Mismatch repair endonuclease PMS2 n=1 Tax=Vanrija pseudolonga TaxID=143232 RepID=A0AAF0Y1X7_9TREE|nr:Mismatch repair endonuclease PMS2 [Vanrija pseudolonga]
MAAASIKPIDAASVHSLHSGQVVLDLPGAVKELLENSLDAGATIIDVRIKDSGLDTLEVVDNGSGIAAADYDSIGLKHHTSKLPSLAALSTVDTFGFRGEALSALCALCDGVTVTTATAETAPMGAVLGLGRDGRVQSTGKVARQRGTTVSVSGLFAALPVRRKEFERTHKREYAKALGILTAYALVPASAGRAVRLKVESVGGGRGGKRHTVLAVDGKGGLRASVAAVWGPKALEGVVDVDLSLEVAIDKAMARREGIEEGTQQVRVSGLISSGAWGQGRSSADRQFVYINGRPCALPKVLRTVNEVYKSFNTNQVPLAILDFTIPRESVDINVSPDKRTIFVHSEANLIDALRDALDKFFQPTRSSYAVSGASQTVKLVQPSVVAPPTTIDEEEEEDREEGRDEDAPADEPEETQAQPNAQRRASSRASRSSSRLGLVESEGEEELSQPLAPIFRRRREPSPPPRLAQQTLDPTVASWSPKRKSTASTSASRAPASGREARSNLRQRLAGYASQPVAVAEEEEIESEEDEVVEMEVEVRRPSRRREVATSNGDEDGDTAEVDTEAIEADELDDDAGVEDDDPAEDADVNVDVAPTEDDVEVPDDSGLQDELQSDRTSLSPTPTPEQDDAGDAEATSPPSGYRDEIQSAAATGEATLRFDLDRLRARYAKRQGQQPAKRSAYAAVRAGAVSDAAGVGNRDAAAAEAALARVISKDDFARMQVLGQFNKGFIIARLRHEGSDDLFIVDQHASDEKFNFETLQRTTVIKAQALIRPRPMQLTSADEIVAMENLDVLEANGFKVGVDEDAAPGRGERITLQAMPVSKETTFDFKDLEQLLHLLGDGARPQGQMVRCSKARAMFAMRACRRSVMIGKSLTKAQMVALLRNMGTIDQPWNCPHGRPTMRHMCELTPPSRPHSGRGRIDWAKWE